MVEGTDLFKFRLASLQPRRVLPTDGTQFKQTKVQLDGLAMPCSVFGSLIVDLKEPFA